MGPSRRLLGFQGLGRASVGEVQYQGISPFGSGPGWSLRAQLSTHVSEEAPCVNVITVCATWREKAGGCSSPTRQRHVAAQRDVTGRVTASSATAAAPVTSARGAERPDLYLSVHGGGFHRKRQGGFGEDSRSSCFQPFHLSASLPPPPTHPPTPRHTHTHTRTHTPIHLPPSPFFLHQRF